MRLAGLASQPLPRTPSRCNNFPKYAPSVPVAPTRYVAVGSGSLKLVLQVPPDTCAAEAIIVCECLKGVLSLILQGGAPCSERGQPESVVSAQSTIRCTISSSPSPVLSRKPGGSQSATSCSGNTIDAIRHQLCWRCCPCDPRGSHLWHQLGRRNGRNAAAKRGAILCPSSCRGASMGLAAFLALPQAGFPQSRLCAS